MLKRIQRFIAIAVIFCLVSEQSGFAQIAPQMNMPAYLTGLVLAQAFRPMHLRSMSLDETSQNIQLLLDKGDAKSVKEADVKEAAKQLLDYFQTGLRLPDSVFWVNLRPDSDKDIIDPYLERTDLGRVLLEADLQLKKDLARLTSPRTKEGRVYWDKLYAKAESIFGNQDIEIPTLTRPWIVPGEILIKQSQGSAYVYKATLKVMLEQDYIKDSPFYGYDDPRLKELNEYSSQLIRSTILPQLTREVNSARRYAALRQVYYSLVLAQWFKRRYAGESNQYASNIDSKDLSGLISARAWSKARYYKEYQRSFKEGEYDVEETRAVAQGVVIRRYFSGGIKPIIQEGVLKSLDGPVTIADPDLLRVTARPVMSDGWEINLEWDLKKGNMDPLDDSKDLLPQEDKDELLAELVEFGRWVTRSTHDGFTVDSEDYDTRLDTILHKHLANREQFDDFRNFVDREIKSRRVVKLSLMVLAATLPFAYLPFSSAVSFDIIMGLPVLSLLFLLGSGFDVEISPVGDDLKAVSPHIFGGPAVSGSTIGKDGGTRSKRVKHDKSLSHLGWTASRRYHGLFDPDVGIEDAKAALLGKKNLIRLQELDGGITVKNGIRVGSMAGMAGILSVTLGLVSKATGLMLPLSGPVGIIVMGVICVVTGYIIGDKIYYGLEKCLKEAVAYTFFDQMYKDGGTLDARTEAFITSTRATVVNQFPYYGAVIEPLFDALEHYLRGETIDKTIVSSQSGYLLPEKAHDSLRYGERVSNTSNPNISLFFDEKERLTGIWFSIDNIADGRDLVISTLKGEEVIMEITKFAWAPQNDGTWKKWTVSKRLFPDDANVQGKDGGNEANKVGGIDLRTLPVTEFQSGQSRPAVADPAMMAITLGELNQRWLDIQKKICSGPMPYGELGKFIAVCHARKDAAKQLREASAYIIAILKTEEAAAVASTPELVKIVSLI